MTEGGGDLNAIEAQNRLKKELESEQGFQIFINLNRTQTYTEEDYQKLKKQTLEMVGFGNDE